MSILKKLSPLLILVVLACNSSKITSSYTAKATGKQEFFKVLVLGLGKDSDLELQAKMENHMADDMRERGYDVITSVKEYGPGAFKGMTEEQSLAKLKNSQVDAIVTIVLLNKKSEKQFIPARDRGAAPHQFQHLFWDYYGDINKRVIEPGYYFENTEYYWESNLFEVRTQDLLYSAKTTSFNPSNTELLAHHYGKMIVRNMARKNVISRNPEPVKKGF